MMNILSSFIFVLLASGLNTFRASTSLGFVSLSDFVLKTILRRKINP